MLRTRASNRPTRLVFIAPSAYKLGGMQVWLKDLVSSLSQYYCWHVNVALTSGVHHDLRAYQSAYPDLLITSLLNPSGSAEGRRRAISSYLLAHDPDLVIGVNIVDLYPAARRARARGFNGKVVQSLHAIDSDLLADITDNSDLLDAVITTNRLSCALVERHAGLPPSRVFYAPYGVNVSSLAVQNSDLPPLRIAWLGRLEQPQKRVHDLVPILQHLTELGINFKLTIAGDGPETASLRGELDPWIRSGTVVMAGALSGEQLAGQLYATHHALLITSSWETGPIVAWEAMAAGLAVVSSAYVGSGLEQALVDGQTALLFPVGDAAAAARALSRLQDSSLRMNLCRTGRSLVEQRYTAEASCNAWIQSFEKVLALPPRPLPAPEPPIAPSGRLDRWLGIGLAESLRRLLGVRFKHSSPGGEWPHTGHAGSDENALLSEAAVLDGHA